MARPFKKKIDWSKFKAVETTVEEPVKENPKKCIKYPYNQLIRRGESTLLTDTNFSLHITYTAENEATIGAGAMRVALLMDLRDRFDKLLDRFDTLIRALNNSTDSDTIKNRDTVA